MDARLFVCAECQEMFKTTWTDEDAKAELAANYPGVPLEECAYMCDDCYRHLRNREAKQPEQPDFFDQLEPEPELMREDMEAAALRQKLDAMFNAAQERIRALLLRELLEQVTLEPEKDCTNAAQDTTETNETRG